MPLIRGEEHECPHHKTMAHCHQPVPKEFRIEESVRLSGLDNCANYLLCFGLRDRVLGSVAVVLLLIKTPARHSISSRSYGPGGLGRI